MKRIFVAFGFALTLGLAAYAQSAKELFENGKHEEAVALAKPLAEKGDPEATYLMGFAYESGKGLPQSRDEAIAMYRKGLAKKHADSIYRLSFLLMASQDEKEREEARKLLEEQAKNDAAVAGRILGEAWLRGSFDGKADSTKAIYWWKRAVEEGDIASMLFLARLHDGQLGFPDVVDGTLAMEYFEQAAAKGNAGAMVAVGSRLLYGNDEKKRDEKRGLALLAKAIEAKEYSAYLALGTYQEQVKKDDKAALAEYERGEAAGQIDSAIRAAQYHLEGKGTEKDVARGRLILEKVAENGSAQAHFLLAVSYLQQEKPDIASGYRHLVASANGGLVAAQNELGLFYLAGNLGVSDLSAAVSWFGRAAQSGHPAAQNNLAALHERGSGVEQSYEKAARLYALAAQQGHAGATLALARFQAAGAATTKQNLELAWALGTLAGERGEPNAAEFVKALEKDFSKDQLAAGKKELERVKSDKPAE